MKRYSAAQARSRLSDLLDAVQAGEDVVIERRGVSFRLQAAASAPRRGPRRRIIEFVDPAVLSGQWTWEFTRKGLAFKPRRRR